MDSLATVAQLADFSQQPIDDADTSAVFLLSVASGMIRSHLGQTITQVTDDVEYLDPVNGAFASLAQTPVTVVSKVEVTRDGGLSWVEAPVGSYSVSRRKGTITAKAGAFRWPWDEESWRVTYTHGFEEVPDEIIGVCCGLAARYYSTPIAVDMERVGQRQVKYAIEADGFSALESMALSAYRFARFA